MTSSQRNAMLAEKASEFLEFLCGKIPSRRVGSPGNQQAARFLADHLTGFGYQVETPPFDCQDWEEHGADCVMDGASFPVEPSPYSPGCEITAPLRAAATLAELRSVTCRDDILLLHGEIAREQLMPKNFTFYNPEEHQWIIALLEEKAPAAIIAATFRNPELAGAVYPFPLIEDGDFNIPSVFTTAETGEEILKCVNRKVHLASRAKRIPSTGSNVVARRNTGAMEKVVVCAHFDAKLGTPGALDNAAGVVTLLLAAELLQDYSGCFELELLGMNGEDYYGANGEKLYLSANEAQLQRINLMINMDGLGYIHGRTAFSTYNLDEARLSGIRNLIEKHPGIFIGEPWYQGDHMILVMNGVPALAVTTELFMELESEYAHTSRDTPELVDVNKLLEAALAIDSIIRTL